MHDMTARLSWAAGQKCNRGRAGVGFETGCIRQAGAREGMHGIAAMDSDGRTQYGSSLYQSREVTGQKAASTVEVLPCSFCPQGLIGLLFGARITSTSAVH